jgi:two-component system capsular synthesis response regulator RcsB
VFAPYATPACGAFDASVKPYPTHMFRSHWMTLRILLADDHPVITAAIRARVQSSQTGWEVCGEAASATELQQQVDCSNRMWS